MPASTIYYFSVGITVVAKGHRARRHCLQTSSGRKTVLGILHVLVRLVATHLITCIMQAKDAKIPTISGYDV
uniref:Uncharacterized protein n=1 Tax=Romanomermis culicivorax TaxID=13658 RepID=A0A915HKE1_ROMCU